MDVQNIIRIIVWAALFGLVVIVGTRFAGSLASRVPV